MPRKASALRQLGYSFINFGSGLCQGLAQKFSTTFSFKKGTRVLDGQWSIGHWRSARVGSKPDSDRVTHRITECP